MPLKVRQAQACCLPPEAGSGKPAGLAYHAMRAFIFDRYLLIRKGCMGGRSPRTPEQERNYTHYRFTNFVKCRE